MTRSPKLQHPTSGHRPAHLRHRWRRRVHGAQLHRLGANPFPFMQALSLLLTFGVAGLVGPFAGALGDRFDRRKVMIWSEAISAVFFAAMVFAHARSC